MKNEENEGLGGEKGSWDSVRNLESRHPGLPSRSFVLDCCWAGKGIITGFYWPFLPERE